MQFGGDPLVDSVEIFGAGRFEVTSAGLLRERLELRAGSGENLRSVITVHNLRLCVEVNRVDRDVFFFDTRHQLLEAAIRPLLIGNRRAIHAVGENHQSASTDGVSAERVERCPRGIVEGGIAPGIHNAIDALFEQVLVGCEIGYSVEPSRKGGDSDPVIACQ